MTEEIGSLKEQLSEVEQQLKVSKASKRKTQLLLFAVVVISIFLVLFDTEKYSTIHPFMESIISGTVLEGTDSY